MTDTPRSNTSSDNFPSKSIPRRHAPATARNRAAILAVLRDILPQEGLLLEIASGTGEHAAWLGPQLAPLRWQTSEYSRDNFPDITAYLQEAGADNLLPPVHIDTTSNHWPLEQADAAACINMLHIAPWAATCGLFAGMARILKPDSPLYLYGPFFQDGVPTAPSNLNFDASLRNQNKEWGIRSLEDVQRVANEQGFDLERVVAMPANNLSVIFKRTFSPPER
ncbi:DUF938 domain-containing protein [Kiloniella laminariae]|uniref:DUF938 domain-containing protein n=1 Tax=Kiloniella laminariae TaxID=454162 RepID=A0ABT4LK49_9PROT|nr:DUF938 domain-containing protein [Kiloniella laminariae]MCZ4281459.1 DUF938 domain-containing protein [Kiloniella laminariae]